MGECRKVTWLPISLQELRCNRAQRLSLYPFRFACWCVAVCVNECMCFRHSLMKAAYSIIRDVVR